MPHVTGSPGSVNILPLDPPEESPDALQAVSANRMPWLFGIFSVGIALLVGLKIFFAELYVELEQRGGNERSRLFIGDEIVREIGSIETAVYRLALADNPPALKRARQDIEAQLGTLADDLAKPATPNGAPRNPAQRRGARRDGSRIPLRATV